MARYLKGSCNNAWDKAQDDDRPRRVVNSYFGSMSDDRLRDYLVSARAQLAERRDICMSANVREAQAELDRRELVVDVA